MHMADALLSPAVGGVFWLVSGSLIAYSAKKIKKENDNSKTPLMGVLGAFVFAAQMINFTIPGTGSSGHLGGGLLLAIMLGPYRAFITIASILTIQCLFFADGGLVALGCNIFNIGFFPAFIAYPFIYRTILGQNTNTWRIATASITAAATGLLMGSFSVVIQTLLSGISELPFLTFTLFMLPIHLVIGVVEGVVVMIVITFIIRTQPVLLIASKKVACPNYILMIFALATIISGGILAWFASTNPDGLEWSIANVTGSEVFESHTGTVHNILTTIQEKVAFLPDYSFKPSEVISSTNHNSEVSSKSAVSAATSISGVIGSIFVLILSIVTGLFLRAKSTRPQQTIQ